MKILLFILTFFLFTGVTLFAQDDDTEQGGKIQQRMQEYIQNRLGLSKSEAEKFTPVYLRYFLEMKRVHQETRDLPPIDRQQRLLETRIKYRDEFKPIIGEERANKVFVAEGEFKKLLMDELRQRRQERFQKGPGKRFRSLVQ